MSQHRRRAVRQPNRRDPLDAARLALLLEGDDRALLPVEAFALLALPGRLAAVWNEHRDALLPAYIAAHPGHRPFCWWRFDAPRWLRADLPARLSDLPDEALGEFEAPRRRVGGIGDPVYEHLNYKPEFRFGVPVRFVAPAFCNGRFTGRAVDPDDPPRYESQASYLRRHGLLTDAERRALTQVDYDAEDTL